MHVHLVDGTYELFRHFFAIPHGTDVNGQEIAAVRGVLSSVLSMLDKGATHIAVATDHVIESFRNDLYPYYKTSAGVPVELLWQFHPLEDALSEMGVVVWPMVEFEADDALAAAAAKAAQDARVEQVIICTPDKDLSQSVCGERIVQLDRRRDIVRDETGVVEKFGVKPESIPDYLAVVGDTADGYPGLKGWGAKAAASVLSLYPHLENVPADSKDWSPSIRGSSKLATTLRESWDEALLFRQLATLRLDAPVFNNVDELRWSRPLSGFESLCERMKAPELYRRANAIAAKLSAQSV